MGSKSDFRKFQNAQRALPPGAALLQNPLTAQRDARAQVERDHMLIASQIYSNLAAVLTAKALQDGKMPIEQCRQSAQAASTAALFLLEAFGKLEVRTNEETAPDEGEMAFDEGGEPLDPDVPDQESEEKSKKSPIILA